MLQEIDTPYVASDSPGIFEQGEIRSYILRVNAAYDQFQHTVTAETSIRPGLTDEQQAFVSDWGRIYLYWKVFFHESLDICMFLTESTYNEARNYQQTLNDRAATFAKVFKKDPGISPIRTVQSDSAVSTLVIFGTIAIVAASAAYAIGQFSPGKK